MKTNLKCLEPQCNNMLNFEDDEGLLIGVDMEWATPRYSRREVNEAAKYLIGEGSTFDVRKFDDAIGIVNNFRAAHAFPLNTLQIRLRINANSIDRHSIVAQRLKRLSSIWAKLERFETMELWDMQDIGGCRAVVANVKNVKQLADIFKSSRIRHKLVHEDDYIQKPRTSGYRSWHLIYRYISDHNEIYNGLKVEIQIRTPLQHAWATTVETVDIFTEQALKSSMGRPDWERFFQLMGTWMAFRESTSPVQDTPTNRVELREELRECANKLQVINCLRGFASALRVTRQPFPFGKDADYFLLSLDNNAERLSIIGYNRKELTRAAREYATKEKQIRHKRGRDSVLVSVDSVRNLQRAYPNYFADTSRFVAELREALKQ